MTKNILTIDKTLLKRFFPLSSIDETYLDQFKQTALISTFFPGDVIHKSGANNGLNHFLINGTVEARITFAHRVTLSPGDEQSQFCLEQLVKAGGVIKASTKCNVLVANVQTIDQLVSWSQSYNYQIMHTNDFTAALSDEPIDDSYHEDWSSRFIHSPLAANLSPSSLHTLFTALEPVEYEPGEEVVKRNTPGDYFYIVQEGFVRVVTDEAGPFQGKVFTLGPGDYFGDEALVADTLRNATVVTDSPATVARLCAEKFEEIVKRPLVRKKEAAELKAANADNFYYIDVRLPIEFKKGHLAKSENIPISHLRQQLNSFDYTRVYYVTGDGGSRSELATYLLRQAGYEAYCLVS